MPLVGLRWNLVSQHCWFRRLRFVNPILAQACHGRYALQVWDVRTRKVKVDLPGHADEVFTVDWSPDGSGVASGGKDRVLKLWRH